MNAERFFTALLLAVVYALEGVGMARHGLSTDNDAGTVFAILLTIYFWPVIRDFVVVIYRVLRVARAADRKALAVGSRGPNCPPLPRV